MNALKICVCLFFWSIIALPLWAQLVHSEVFDLQRGLPSMQVNALHQDQRGYLWIGTQAGLVRYNSYEFEYYTTANGLVNNQITQIAEDKKGRFWILGERASLALWQDGRLGAHRLSAHLQAIAKGRGVAYFDIDASDTLWVALSNQPPHQTDYKVYFASEKDSIWRAYDSLNIATNAAVSATYYYNIRRSILYASLPFLLGKTTIDRPAMAIRPKQQDDFLQLTQGGNCHCLAQGQRLRCINEKYTATFTLSGEIIAQDSFRQPLPKVAQFYIDKNNQAWAATAEGAYLWADGNLSQSPTVYFATHNVRQVYQDREGNYWLATLGDGLVFMPYLHIQVQAVSPYSHQNHILHLLHTPPFVQALSATGMVYKLSQQTVLPTYYNQSATPAIAWHYDTTRQHILLGNGNSIEAATGNAAWAWWNSSQHGATQARCFAQIDNNNILVGSEYGFAHIDMATHQPRWQSNQIGFGERVNAIFRKNQDTFLIATASGIYKYAHASQSIAAPENLPAFGQYTNNISYYGNNRQLIIATMGAGLWYEQPKGWARIDSRTGLSSDFVQKIFVQNPTTWWVATNKGLDKIIWANDNHAQPLSIIKYSSRNGLPNNGINDILATNDQRLWLATDAGIVSFLPNALAQTKGQTAPTVHISRLAVNGQDMPVSDSFELDYWQENIQIQYLGIHFRERGQLVYRYRLEGKDTDWQITQDKSIQYTNLPVGDYVFWVTSLADDGTANPNIAKIRFTIRPAFWQTPWFRWALAGAGLLAVLLVVWQARRRARLQKQLWASKQNALHAQMNPHFIFNAMNSILYFVRQNDKRQATAFLASFSSLIRRILDNSKRSLISLSEEVDTLQRYLELERLRLSNPSDNFRIEVATDIDPQAWQLPPMLIQPLIENSIMHGLLPKTEGERQLLVSITVEKKKLRISVEDNGIGRKAAAEIRSRRNITHTSYGSQNIDERVRLLNQIYKKAIKIEIKDLFDEQQAAAGTRIIVWIPMGL